MMMKTFFIDTKESNYFCQRHKFKQIKYLDEDDLDDFRSLFYLCSTSSKKYFRVDLSASLLATMQPNDCPMIELVFQSEIYIKRKCSGFATKYILVCDMYKPTDNPLVLTGYIFTMVLLIVIIFFLIFYRKQIQV